MLNRRSAPAVNQRQSVAKRDSIAAGDGIPPLTALGADDAYTYPGLGGKV